MIGIVEAAGSPWSGVAALTGLPAFLVIDDSAYNRSSTFTYPTGRDSKPGQSNEDWTMTFAPAGGGGAGRGRSVGERGAGPGDSTDSCDRGRAGWTSAWTNPSTALDSVKVVRKAGSAPADPATGRRC